MASENLLVSWKFGWAFILPHFSQGKECQTNLFFFFSFTYFYLFLYIKENSDFISKYREAKKISVKEDKL